MQFSSLFKYFACVCIISALILTTACKKDAVVTTTGNSTKCDYSPYSAGSKFVFQSALLTTDTIVSDTTINSLKYAKGIRTQQASTGSPAITSLLYRCDATGSYKLADKASFYLPSLTSFGATKEIQLLKLPASVGTTWQSDTIKYSTTRGDYGLLYKFKTTALGGTKTHNGVVYANDLITVQNQLIIKSKENNVTRIDTFGVVSLVFDKKFGLIETTQNGIVTEYLKSSIVK